MRTTVPASCTLILFLGISAYPQILSKTPFPDVTGDEAVDQADLWLLVPQWGQPGIADLDNDGFIGPNDLMLLQQGWHQKPPTPTPLPPTPTPNPAVEPLRSTIIAQEVMGPEGGSLNVSETHPELGGSGIYFPVGSLNAQGAVSLASISDVDLRGEADRDNFLGAIAIEVSGVVNGIPPVGFYYDGETRSWIVTLRLRKNRPVGDRLDVREFDLSTGNFRQARFLNVSPIIAIAVEETKALFAIDHSSIYALQGTYSYTGAERESSVQIGGFVERPTWDVNKNEQAQPFFFPPYFDDGLLRDGRALTLPSWQRHAWKEVIKELLVQTQFAIMPRDESVDDVFANITRYTDVMDVVYALADAGPGINIFLYLGDLPRAFTEMKIVAENAHAVRGTLKVLYAAALERQNVQRRAQALQDLVRGTWLETNGPFQSGFEDALYEIGCLWVENCEKVLSNIQAGALLESGYNIGIHVGAPVAGRALVAGFVGVSSDTAAGISFLFNTLYSKIQSRLKALECGAVMSCLATLDQVVFHKVPFDGDVMMGGLGTLTEEGKTEVLLRLYSAWIYYRNYSLFLRDAAFPIDVLSPLFRTPADTKGSTTQDIAAGLRNASLVYAEKRINQIKEAYRAVTGVEGYNQYFATGTWRRVATTGLEARLHAAMAYDGIRQRVILHGGLSRSPENRGSGTWEWDVDGWRQIAESGPEARWGHAMAYDAARGKIVLFGGQSHDLSIFFGDTWEWDGSEWTRAASAGPAARWGHSMAYDEARGKVVLFGGQPRDLSTFFDDTWEWDGVEWTQIAVAGPTARVGSAMAYDALRGKVVLFGGAYDWSRFGDTWEWDGTRWTEAATAGPDARSSHAMVYDTSRARIVLFGGISSRSEAVPGGYLIREIRLRDTWEWDGTQWQEVATAGPEARYRHAMAYDTARMRVVLFGGIGAEPFSDTWEYAVE